MTSADRFPMLSPGSAVVAALPFVFLALSGCTPPGPQEHLFSGETMATTYHVKVVAELDGAARDVLAGEIQAVLDALDAKLSTYRPDSELSRFNAHASTEAFPLSAETLELFSIAREISAQTGGAFDVTVGPIVNAYGFGPLPRTEPPGDAELEQLRERVSYQYLTIDQEAGTLQKARPDVYCDLSAIAQGCGTDAVARLLESRNITRFMVEVSGEVRTMGLNARGAAWQIGIETPVDGKQGIEKVIPISNMSLATSGDYRNYYERDGVRISHTIDARTGRPITHGLASVTILHESCTWADAYATALNVLGPVEGHAFAVRQGLPALFILREGQGFTQKTTPAFDAHMKEAQAP